MLNRTRHDVNIFLRKIVQRNEITIIDMRRRRVRIHVVGFFVYIISLLKLIKKKLYFIM